MDHFMTIFSRQVQGKGIRGEENRDEVTPPVCGGTFLALP